MPFNVSSSCDSSSGSSSSCSSSCSSRSINSCGSSLLLLLPLLLQPVTLSIVLVITTTSTSTSTTSSTTASTTYPTSAVLCRWRKYAVRYAASSLAARTPWTATWSKPTSQTLNPWIWTPPPSCSSVPCVPSASQTPCRCASTS